MPPAPPSKYNDPEPTHTLEVWVAETNFSYWMHIVLYHSEQDAKLDENLIGGWGQRIDPGEHGILASEFYGIPESAEYIWIQMELERCAEGEDIFMDSKLFQLALGVRKTITLGGLEFKLLLSLV